MGLGEAAALTTAFLWAFASLLYDRIRLPAASINLGKNVLACLLLLVQMGITSQVAATPMFAADGQAWLWLTVSGVIGIALGDTLYFRGLQILGPRRTLILTTTAPVLAALLGWLLLDETLGWLAIVGIVITLSGIVIVVSEEQNPDESAGLFPGKSTTGVICALLAAVCTALGGVASKIGMEQCDPLEATFIRLFVAIPFTLIAVVATKQLKSTATELKQFSVLRWFVPAVICGTWLGIWLCQIAYKHSEVAIATTLVSTCPLFAIPLVAFFLKQKVTLRAVVGTVIAITGVAVLVTG